MGEEANRFPDPFKPLPPVFLSIDDRIHSYTTYESPPREEWVRTIPTWQLLYEVEERLVDRETLGLILAEFDRRRLPCPPVDPSNDSPRPVPAPVVLPLSDSGEPPTA